MAGCKTPGSLGVGCNQPVIDRGTTARTEHQPPGPLRPALMAAPLFMIGPLGTVLGSAYVLGQVYYRDNLAALDAASERALLLAPVAIAEATGFDDLGKLLDTVLKGLLAALIGLGATTALGATIGGIVGFFVGGAGAAPGAVAGAKVGFDVGVAILTWLGLGFLITSIGQGLGELAAMLTQGIRRAWEAGNSKNVGGCAAEIDLAAKDLAMAIGILIRLILEGILAYLMRGAPMATARTAAGTVGRVRAGESGAVAAETVAEVVKNLRASKLGKGFADWIELNWRKLLDNPKLRRPGTAAAPASGGSTGKAQTPNQARQEVEGKKPPQPEEQPQPKRPPVPAAREIKELPEYQGMTKTQIEKDLAQRGYSRTPSNDGTGSVWTKASSDGNTAAVRLDDAIVRNPPKNFADEVPHLHKEVVRTSEVANGNYPGPDLKFDDLGNSVTGPTSQTANRVHIPIKWE